MVSRIFRSSDTDAPSLTATLGSFYNVLKAVLCDGYGSTASLGWEFMFGDQAAGKLVVRQKTALGFKPYLQFHEYLSGSSLYCACNMYSLMYDESSGVHAVPEYIEDVKSGDPYNEGTMYISNPSGNPIDWIIVGDDSGFNMFTRSWQYDANGANYDKIYFNTYVGDLIPLYLKTYFFCGVMNRYSYNYGMYDGSTRFIMLGDLKNNNQLGRTDCNVFSNSGDGRVGSHVYNPAVNLCGKNVYSSLTVIDVDVSGSIGLAKALGYLPILNKLNSGDSVTAPLEDQIVTETVVSSNTTIITIPCRYYVYDPVTGYLNWVSVIVGEGFRNAL